MGTRGSITGDKAAGV